MDLNGSEMKVRYIAASITQVNTTEKSEAECHYATLGNLVVPNKAHVSNIMIGIAIFVTFKGQGMTTIGTLVRICCLHKGNGRSKEHYLKPY